MPFLHLPWKTLLWLIENIDAGTEGITLSFVSANSSQQNPAGGFRGLGLFLKYLGALCINVIWFYCFDTSAMINIVTGSQQNRWMAAWADFVKSHAN